jgi:diketogulonate reductase-like aldo/keto reductase
LIRAPAVGLVAEKLFLFASSSPSFVSNARQEKLIAQTFYHVMMFTQSVSRMIGSLGRGAPGRKNQEARVAEAVTAEGVPIPKIGCGTYPMRGPACAEIVAEALRVGFRHVDTAQGYDNEAAVGEGVLLSGVPREEIFITTKVQPQLIADGQLQRSVEESLKRLKTDVVDLLLIHWPNPEVPVAESMRALSAAKRLGMTRAIGVSNFVIAKLEEAIRVSPEPITVVQFEYHPYLDQARLLAAARRHKLAITAYCPLALGRVAGDPRLMAIGKKHGKSAAQVTLRWLVQQEDVIAIPKTSTPGRLKENLAVFDFRLTDEEMDQISRMTVPNSRLINEPLWVPHWD